MVASDKSHSRACQRRLPYNACSSSSKHHLLVVVRVSLKGPQYRSRNSKIYLRRGAYSRSGEGPIYWKRHSCPLPITSHLHPAHPNRNASPPIPATLTPSLNYSAGFHPQVLFPASAPPAHPHRVAAPVPSFASADYVPATNQTSGHSHRLSQSTCVMAPNTRATGRQWSSGSFSPAVLEAPHERQGIWGTRGIGACGLGLSVEIRECCFYCGR